jgi:two-component system OmpR family sensor kinase
MMRAFDSLVARLLLVSLAAVTVVHLISLWTYERALDQERSAAYETRLAERLVTIKRSVMVVPPDEREALAHDLSSGPIEAHWNTTRGAVAGGPGADAWQRVAERIVTLAGDLGADDVVVGTSTDPHVALLSLRLPDDSWLNVNLFAASGGRPSEHGMLLSTSLMAFGVVVVSLLVAGWVARPLRRISEAVTRLSPEDPAGAVPEGGPREIRDLASAFNALRGRIADLIERRTRALAAVSHDLRTPLTRLKLRVDDVADVQLRSAMGRDIDEMEQMIAATLSYLKGEETAEAARSVDLVALLETLADAARDQGRDVTLDAPPSRIVVGRPIGLRRAFGNLVGNAARFATTIEISVRDAEDRVLVTVSDNGPGIPSDKLDAVLEPFVRLEDSRNVETGGVGLGLTIAKAAIEADGGRLELTNRAGGGLAAIVSLPRPAA